MYVKLEEGMPSQRPTPLSPSFSLFPLFPLLPLLLQHNAIHGSPTGVHVQAVVDVSKRYLPFTSTAYDHPKVLLHVADGIEFLRRVCAQSDGDGVAKEEKFDVIITDSSDPVGMSSFHVLSGRIPINRIKFRAKFFSDFSTFLEILAIRFRSATSLSRFGFEFWANFFLLIGCHINCLIGLCN